MQWYVYLMTIPALFFLGQVAVELIGRPVKTILRLRHHALEQLVAFRNMPLPRPRELAVSSRQIRAHDDAARNVRQAQRTFADLGAQLLAFGESEPNIRNVMVLCGLDMARAGYELINLSEIYATAKIDSDELRRAIEKAYHAASCALAASQRGSGGDELTKIRLEPMYLREASSSARRKRPLSRPHAVARRAPLRARASEGGWIRKLDVMT